MTDRQHFFSFVAILVVALSGAPSARAQTPPPSLPPSLASAPGTLRVSPFDAPFSTFASASAQQKFVDLLHRESPPSAGGAVALREFYARFNDKTATRMKTLYSVKIEPQTMAGVSTEIITPLDGIPAKNSERVLINLHGGGFEWGGASAGEVESIPIASLGKIRVITVLYRLGPENVFPAASEDVAAVYEELLKKYKPANIGIYGCSAGGILTAESMAWFDKIHLPMPGAIGTFCGSIALPEGDSAYTAPVLNGIKGQPAPYPIAAVPYFRGANLHDPRVADGHPRTLCQRPGG
jgi:monoterpene epsilon-lactone hydrolase